MKKIFLVLSAILLSICAMSAKAQTLNKEQQHAFIKMIADEIKSTSSLPSDQGEGVIWQDIYANKNNLTLEFIIKHDSKSAGLGYFEPYIEKMVDELMCQDQEMQSFFQELDITFVILFKFNDQMITMKKSAQNCSQ